MNVLLVKLNPRAKGPWPMQDGRDLREELIRTGVIDPDPWPTRLLHSYPGLRMDRWGALEAWREIHEQSDDCYF